MEGGDPDTFLQSNPIPLYAEMDIMFITVKLFFVKLVKCLISVYFFGDRGTRYSLLAYTTLGLEQAEGSFQSHSLIIQQNGKRNQATF